MIEFIRQITPYVVSAGGVVAYGLAWQQRKANTNKVNIEISELSQKIYQGIITDLKKEVAELKEEVFMLRKVVESYKEKCEGCPNNKNKK